MGSVFLGLASIVAGAFLLQISNGWLGILVPLRLGIEGYSAAVVGLVVTAHSVGFLVGCIFAPRLVGSLGHIRAFAVLAASVSVATMAFTATVDPLLWGPLRLVTG
ncbi:MAG: MFS transporter, partial [Alphaproteobacteria bacterium]